MSIFDKNDKIIFSNTYNVLDNSLIIEKIFNSKFDLEINLSRTEDKKPLLKIEKIDEKIIIKLINFYLPLGIGTTQKISLLKDEASSKQLLLSIYVQAINESNDFANITLTFYERQS